MLGQMMTQPLLISSLIDHAERYHGQTGIISLETDGTISETNWSEIAVNARRLALAPMFAALAIGAATDRPVRFVGRPDVAPVGPMMQRLGALLPADAEILGALRAGEVVVIGAEHEPTNRRTGLVDHRQVGAAVAAKAQVLPAATVSVPLRRNARVEIGPAVRLRKRRRGPLEELETADLVQSHIDAMLAEMGGTMTGTPLDWLPTGGLGGL